jgi:hypothetical protein
MAVEASRAASRLGFSELHPATTAPNPKSKQNPPRHHSFDMVANVGKLALAVYARQP